MSDIDQKMLDAYRDGELTVSEVLQLEKQMSDTDRENLEQDRNFEEALAKSLTPMDCPEALWLGLVDELSQEEKASPTAAKAFPLWRWFSGFGAVASVALGIFFFNFYEWHPHANGPVDTFPQDVAGLERLIDVPAARLDVNGLLKAKNIPLHFASLSNHELKYLGAERLEVSRASLLFDCCGEPVRISVVPADVDLSATLLKYSTSRRAGDYKVFFEGRHFDQKLLDSFNVIN